MENELRDEIHELLESVTSKIHFIEEKDHLLQEKEGGKMALAEKTITFNNIYKRCGKRMNFSEKKSTFCKQTLNFRSKRKSTTQERFTYLPATAVTAMCAAYTCQVSGPGLQSAIANYPMHILVELSGSLCSQHQNIYHC